MQIRIVLLTIFLFVNFSCRKTEIPQSKNLSGNLQLITQLNDCEIYSPLFYHDYLYFIQKMNKPRKNQPDGRIVQFNPKTGNVLHTSPIQEGLSGISHIDSDTIVATGFSGRTKYLIDTNDLSIIKQGITEGEYSSFFLRFDQQYIFLDTYATGMIFQLLSYNEQLNINWSYQAGTAKTARNFLYPNFHQEDNFCHLLSYDEGTIYHIILDLNTGTEMSKEKLLTKDDYTTPPIHPIPYEEIIWGDNQSYFIQSVDNQMSITSFLWNEQRLVESDRFVYTFPGTSYQYSRIIFNGTRQQGSHLIIPMQLGMEKTGGEFGVSYFEWHESRLLVYDVSQKKVVSYFKIPNLQYRSILLGDEKLSEDRNKVFFLCDSEESIINDYIPLKQNRYLDIKIIMCLDYLTGQVLWNKEFDSMKNVLFQESRFWVSPSMYTNQDPQQEYDPVIFVLNTKAEFLFQTKLAKPFAQYRKQNTENVFFTINVLPLQHEKALIISQGAIYLWTVKE